MKARWMRLFVFFDLPTKTKKHKKDAAKFRTILLKDGFIMMQFSIYYRICKGWDSLDSHYNYINLHLPKFGNIRTLAITNKQFEDMKILVGNEEKNETIGKKQLLLF